MNKKFLYTVTEYGKQKAYMVKLKKPNPYQNRSKPYRPIYRVRNLSNPFMTIKQYKSTLRRKRRELYNYDIDSNKCFFVTLTTHVVFS